MRHHLHRLRRGGGQKKARGRKARGGAVIEHGGVVVQHHAIARLAHRQAGKSIHIDPIEKLRHIRTLELDFAERRDIGNAHPCAHQTHFLDIRRFRTIAGPAVIPGPQPRTGLDEHGGIGSVPVMERRAPDRAEVMADAAPRKRTERHRCVGRPEGGCHAHACTLTAHPGHQADGVQVAGLALIGGHAERGVALQVLDRDKTLITRDLQIARGHIGLEIDEGLAAPHQRRARRLHAPGLIGQGGIHGSCRGRVACMPRGRGTRHCALRHRLRERELPRHRARGKMPRCEDAGHKAVDVGPEHRLAAGVGGQMQGAGPATGHAQQIARQCLFACISGGGDACTTHCPRAQRTGNHAAGTDDQACGLGEIAQGRIDVHALLDHCHLGTAARELRSTQPAAVIVGGHHHLLTQSHRPTVQVGLCCRCKHDAGPVVVGEDQRSFQRAGGKHDGAGADAAQHLARRATRGIGHVLVVPRKQRRHGAVVKTKRRRALEDLDTGQTLQRLDLGAAPALLRGIGGEREETAPGQAVLLDQQHAGARLRRRARGREPRGSGADHQHIGETVACLVTIRVWLTRGAAEPRGTADETLVEHPRTAQWTHEGLVVETRADQPGQQAVDGHQVKVNRGRAVLAARNQSFVEFDQGAREVGCTAPAAADREKSVGLFHTGAEKTARAVVLETPPHQSDTVREQRGGQRVAGKPRQRPALQRERERAAAIDAAACWPALCTACHRCATSSRARRTTPGVLVAVSRSSTSQSRQPSTCCQYSRCAPFGLSKTKTWSCHSASPPLPCAGRVRLASPP